MSFRDDDDDDDVSDFLVPPPHHASIPIRMITRGAVVISDEDDDDDGFLQPPAQYQQHRASASPPHEQPPAAPAVTSSIVSELEREVQYWRSLAEQRTSEARDVSRQVVRWRDDLYNILTQSTAHVTPEFTEALDAHIKSARELRGQDLSVDSVLQESPYAFLARTLSRMSTICDQTPRRAPASASVASRLVEPATPAPSRRLFDGHGTQQPTTASGVSTNTVISPVRNTVEDIEVSDTDDTSHKGGSTARALRRQRSQNSGQAPTTVVMPPSDAAVRRAPLPLMDVSADVARRLSILVVDRLRAHHHLLQESWCRQCQSAACSTVTRRAFSLWRRWADDIHTRRIVRGGSAHHDQPPMSDAHRRRWWRLAKLCSDQLYARHVVEGTLRAGWNHWHLFLLCRRQLREVETQLEQYAQHGAVFGALIQNHNAMWGHFVEDAATLLDHQYHGLAALRRAGDRLVFRGASSAVAGYVKEGDHDGAPLQLTES